jgi:hypothetical protein
MTNVLFSVSLVAMTAEGDEGERSRGDVIEPGDNATPLLPPRALGAMRE